MAYATSEQITVKRFGLTVYIGPDEVLMVGDNGGTINLTRPDLGYIMDLCCSLNDYDIQAQELSRKD